MVTAIVRHQLVHCGKKLIIAFFVPRISDQYPVMYQNSGNNDSDIIEITEKILCEFYYYSLSNMDKVVWFPQNYHCRIEINGFAIYVRDGFLNIVPFDKDHEIFSMDDGQYAIDLENALTLCL